jgi:hypothetical protein
MALVAAQRYLRRMDHHHAASLIAIIVGAWVPLFAGMVGAGVAISAGIWSAKHHPARGFDFVASARRIRAMPVPPRDNA